MAENTLQFRWIVTLQGGLDGLFRDDPNVFVAGDLFWYPVEGDNKTRVAPDTMVVFGRPKGDRGSYLQWEEDNIAPQVVFEVLSPGNRPGELVDKFRFYEHYGVDEYYVFDPQKNELDGWIRENGGFKAIDDTDGWTSPRLGIRFDLSSGDLQVFQPDGTRFATYLELLEQEETARQRAERERQRADRERLRAEQERQRAERLAERLRQLGVDPDE
ncbi:MAG: Uma2 family endonuclease [Pirellulaceae bacterium]|nr:Uma2 family endonuclease [Pirellulaceae bacterium]